MRKFVAAASASALAAGLIAGGAFTNPAAADNSGIAEFTTPGNANFTVPPGVETILVEGQGGGGAGGAKVDTKAGGAGGVGALVKASLDVSDVDSLNLRVANGGAVGTSGADGAGRGGGASTITENGGSIGFIAGGGGGGATGYKRSGGGDTGVGNAGGDAGSASNGGGKDGDGKAGGGGGSKGSGGYAGGEGGTLHPCKNCISGKPGGNSAGGDPAAGNADSGQGGFGGAGYGGGGGGALAPETVPIAGANSNGGGGGGGSRADGTAIESKYANITKAATGGGAAGDANPATAGADGRITFNWLVRPTGVHVEPGSGQITVSWVEPAQPAVADANLEDPNYEVYLDGKIQSQVTPDPNGTTITGLQNGKSYAVNVVVTSQAKTGTKYPLKTVSSTVNAGPATTPGTPSTPTITGWGMSGDNGYVNLKWSPPASNGGAAITGYHVQQMVVGGPILWVATQNCGTVQGLSCQVRGLVADVNYVFRVRAENSVGDGSWSNASVKVAPHYVPPAPKNQSVGRCVRKPKRIKLKNRTYPLLAPNCKSNAGQKVTIKVSPRAKAGKKIRYAIFRIGKGKYKNYMGIRTYNVKVKKLRITWSAAAKARPIGQPTGQAYKAWSTSKSYRVR